MHTVVIVAVLPEYRANFLSEMRAILQNRGDTLVLVAGDVHLDRTVKSGIHNGVIPVRNRPLWGGRLLWQERAVRHSEHADVVVADLNPRSLTAWTLLLRCRITHTRILLWGHVLPRKGPMAKTVPLRRLMRRMSDGVISYTWTDAEIVLREDGQSTPVWVAANGLYPARLLGWDADSHRHTIISVGRLEDAKKPGLLLRAFTRALNDLPSDAQLVMVGEGALRHELEAEVQRLGLSARIAFPGHISDIHTLKALYAEAVASVSPGYAGLSLTQSLGFGVPMIIADREPHAPEIELLTARTGMTFTSNDEFSLSEAIRIAFNDGTRWNGPEIVDSMRNRYSSTAMADGFALALSGVPQDLP